MKRRDGYMLLENMVSLSIIMSIVLILYSMMIFCIDLKNSIEDKVELQQQAREMTNHIENTIENSKGIISVNSKEKENINSNGANFINATSIKCKYEDKNKDKEISLKENKQKLFINTLNNEISERGGYEIGDYIDDMYISIFPNGEGARIKLKLSKNKQLYETNFKVYIMNFEGDTI